MDEIGCLCQKCVPVGFVKEMGEQEEELSTYSSEKVVTIRYADLLNKDLDLNDELEKGFGPDGLGIIAVADIPGYPELRKKLLPLAKKMADLPGESLKKLEDPGSGYNFGWSHGAEKFSGQPDFAKGSFYANVCNDTSSEANVKLRRPFHKLRGWSRYPSQCRSNIWPREDLPELEPTFKKMASLIKEMGYILAHHCDKYQYKKSGKMGVLESTLRRSQAHKGRLLYYYPIKRVSEQNNMDAPEWCGWHTDFGSLTGLTAAMYTKGDVEVPCPDSEAGLYTRTSSGRLVRASFLRFAGRGINIYLHLRNKNGLAIYDETDLAYQIGETTELLSGGLFHATTHCVQTSKRNSVGVARSNLAVFMQPSWDEILNIPESMRHKVTPAIRTTTLTFGEYADKTVQAYLNVDEVAS